MQGLVLGFRVALSVGFIFSAIGANHDPLEAGRMRLFLQRGFSLLRP